MCSWCHYQRSCLSPPQDSPQPPMYPGFHHTNPGTPRPQRPDKRDLTDQTLSRGPDPGSSSFLARTWLPPGHSRWGWGLDLSALPFLPVCPSPSGAASSLQNAPGVWALPSPQEAPLGLIRYVLCYSNLLLGLGAPRIWAVAAQG